MKNTKIIIFTLCILIAHSATANEGSSKINVQATIECPELKKVEAAQNKITEDTKFVRIKDLHPGQAAASQGVVESRIRDSKNELEGTSGKRDLFFKIQENKIIPCLTDSTGRKKTMWKPLRALEIPKNLVQEFGGKTYILTDGHHSLIGDLKALQELGVEINDLYQPVNVKTITSRAGDLKVKELDSLTKKQFLQLASQSVGTERLVHLDKTKLLAAENIIDLAEEKYDNPIRDFVDGTRYVCKDGKCTSPKDGKHKVIGLSQDVENGLVLKISGDSELRDPDFIEFIIGQYLEDAGFSFKRGTEVTQDTIEEARKLLLPKIKELESLGVILINEKGYVNQSNFATPKLYCEAISIIEKSDLQGEDKAQQVAAVRALAFSPKITPDTIQKNLSHYMQQHADDLQNFLGKTKGSIKQKFEEAKSSASAYMSGKLSAAKVAAQEKLVATKDYMSGKLSAAKNYLGDSAKNTFASLKNRWFSSKENPNADASEHS